MAANPAFAKFANDPQCCTIPTAMGRASSWWRCTRESNRLGWSSRSILGKVIEEGVTGAGHARSGQPGTWMSPEVELVDRLVARMPSDLREALEADVSRWAPAKTVAAKLGCSVPEYCRRREQSYGWLAGALSATAMMEQPGRSPRD